jgi:hypothetical protein
VRRRYTKDDADGRASCSVLSGFAIMAFTIPCLEYEILIINIMEE